MRAAGTNCIVAPIMRMVMWMNLSCLTRGIVRGWVTDDEAKEEDEAEAVEEDHGVGEPVVAGVEVLPEVEDVVAVVGEDEGVDIARG